MTNVVKRLFDQILSEILDVGLDDIADWPNRHMTLIDKATLS